MPTSAAAWHALGTRLASAQLNPPPQRAVQRATYRRTLPSITVWVAPPTQMRPAHPLQVHTPGPVQDTALACHIPGWCQLGADQPLRKAGIEASSDRILIALLAADEGTDFELRRPIGPWRNHSDAQACQRRMIRAHCEQPIAVVDQQRQPAGSVVHPLRCADSACFEAKALHHPRQQIRLELPRTQQRRRSEGEPFSVVSDSHQPGRTLLDDLAVPWHRALAEPCMAAAERRMARKGQLAAWREDAQAVVGIRQCRRRDERGFTQVGPPGEGSHRRLVETLTIEHDRDRVAEERPFGEDIDLREAACARAGVSCGKGVVAGRVFHVRRGVAQNGCGKAVRPYNRASVHGQSVSRSPVWPRKN